MTLQFLRPGRHKGSDRATRRIQRLLASALSAPAAGRRAGFPPQAIPYFARATAEPVRPTRRTKSLRPATRGTDPAARRTPRIARRLLGFGGLSSLTRRR